MKAPPWHIDGSLDIRFGMGALDQLGDVVAGRRALLVCTPGAADRGLAARAEIAARTVVATDATVVPNPQIDAVEAQAARAIASVPEVILAVGGGSVIDAAKALGVLLGDCDADLGEHLRDGAPLGLRRTIPVVAVPTTAGTGSEVTPFAALWDAATGRKYSLAHAAVRPATAIIDPILTLGLPPVDTVASGLDAVSQALESLWNRHRTPVSRAYASLSLRTSLKAFRSVVADPADTAARSAMCEASLLAGLAIASTRTALAHSMSYPLTSAFGLPHGLACSFSLPALVEFDAVTCPHEMDQVATDAGCLGGAPGLVAVLLDLLRDVGAVDLVRAKVPSLEAMLDLADGMLAPGRAANNIRSASVDDVRAVLARSAELLKLWP